MHPDLKTLCSKLDQLDIGYTTDAICDLREVLYALIAHIQRQIPEEAKPDDEV